MKICSKCKRELPESDFYHLKWSKDGLNYHCKECVRKANRIGKERRREQKKYLPKDNTITNLSGYKIYILDYVKPSEHRYSIVSTKGEVEYFDNRERFLDRIKNII